MSWLLGILRRIIGVGEEEETRPRNSTNRDHSPSYDNTSSRSYVPTTTTASNRDYSPYNGTSSTRSYVPTTTTTTTTARNRDYSPYNDTSSTRSPVPNTTRSTTTSTTLPSFMGSDNPSDAEAWLLRMEKIFDISGCSETQKMLLATCKLEGDAKHWWHMTKQKYKGKEHELIWSTFKKDFKDKYIPPTYTHLTRQASYAQMVSQNRTPNYSNSRNSTPTKLPETLNFSFASSSKTVTSVSTPPPPLASSLSLSSGTPPSSSKPLQPSSKPFLSLAPSSPTHPNSKTAYIQVEKSTSPIYAIPEDFKDSIKKGVVPGILKRPLSPSTYKDYFEALLYAEDFYLEKWDGFEMENVTLELHEAAICKRKGKYNKNVDDEKDDKVFVTFELDSIPERRPFLLSRDFVSVWPSGTNAEPFQGLMYRVVNRNHVLVDFGEDFHDQHYSACKYNVKFSFNRVCLKRAHQAIATASGPLFRNFLFPDSISKNSLTAQLQTINSNLDWHQVSAVHQILSHQNAIPYLVEGPISVCKSVPNWSISRTGFVVCESVLQVYRTSPSCRILICAPTNNACDAITRKLKENIPESDIFRANAAFREFDGVPEDILPSCFYKEESECFYCPSLEELQKFKVISSTFMSSFRLHNEGIMAGHFSHIFLVDASSVIEPEAMVTLAHLADETTAVTITGTPGNHSGWIRSHIARPNGLLMSYFERLRNSKLYESLDSKLITQL